MSKRLILPLPFISSTKSLRLTVTTTTTTTTTFAMSSTSTQSQQQIAIDYHSRTKHSLTTGYARGPHNLDWSNQPNPFLILLPPSSPKIPLLHLPPLPKDSPPYPSLFSSPLPPQPLNLETISRFLYDSLSLSAWKSTGISTWPLRVNPSSGNLHPTESHLILPPSALSPSPLPLLAHYSPLTHSLQCRTHPPLSLFPTTTSSSSSSSSSFFFLALSSILWREAWKYGERAFRYCNHDVGHAIAAISVSAAALGWDVKLLDGLGHDDLENLLGINKLYPSHQPDVLPDKPIRGKLPWVERQHPDCLLLVFPIGTEIGVDYGKMRDVIGEFAGLEWVGEPNSLSKEHVCWDVIYRTADAVKKPFTREEEEGFGVEGWRRSRLISEDLYGEFTVREVVRKRRSAVDMDGVYEMKRDVFYQILLHCLPSGEVGSGENQGRQLALPFRALTWDAEVHAALFVHKVEGLAKGLYFLVRNEEHLDGLKQAMRKDFEWVKPDGCPEGLPLYRLAKGNCERLSKHLSCHQDIASDGCFSLGMIARFESVLREKGAWMYPRLFWETGVLGQVLYLEAHAVGISATGIGCYFDDDVHEVLGLKGSEFQSLYHFTIGSPVVDKRIMSLPAYPGPGMVA